MLRTTLRDQECMTICLPLSILAVTPEIAPRAGLSMNRLSFVVPPSGASRDRLKPELQTAGSWSQCANDVSWELSINRSNREKRLGVRALLRRFGVHRPSQRARGLVHSKTLRAISLPSVHGHNARVATFSAFEVRAS